MSSPRADRGQAAVEYAGALLLVALLLAALFTVLPSVGGTIARAVCVIPIGDDCGAAGSSTPGDDTAASTPGSSGVPEPAATPPVTVPTPAPAPTPTPPGWTGQAANLPRGGTRPYVPPKKSRGKPQRYRGDKGYGWIDKDGNVWKWRPDARPPHWDVQHPDGSHTNVGPDGEIDHGPDRFPNRPRGDGGGGGDDHTAEAVGAAGGAAAIGGTLWWIGKAASPLCGPAAPVCVVVF
jgi:hypothetical protein